MMFDMEMVRQAFAKTTKLPTTDATGVLTATDSRYFPGMQLLSGSLGPAVPLAIFDLGLDEEQREWCRLQGRSLILPESLCMPREIHMWQTWNKPFYISRSPFQQTLWIDSDCVVVGDLSPLFCEIGHGAFVVRHWLDPYEPNNEELYRRFPVAARLPSGKGFNAGVIGLDIVRDADLLESWCWLVGMAARDQEVRSLIGWFDEGAFHWAIQAARRIERLMPHYGWNRYMPSCSSDDPIAYVLACTGHPDDIVWHFSGPQKPW